MEAAGLIEKVDTPKVLRFNFEDVKKLPPPIIAFSEVAFSYSGKKEDYLYKDLSFGIDMDSRCVLVQDSRRIGHLAERGATSPRTVLPSSATTVPASQRCST